MRLPKNFSLIVLVIPLMTVASMVIYLQFSDAKERVYQVIKRYLVEQKIDLMRKYVERLERDRSSDLVRMILDDSAVAAQLEDELALLQGKDVKYLYMLYRDKDGKFRYLIDTTKDENERAFPNQKFDTQTDIWQRAYETQKYQFADQYTLDSLWVTIAYPVVRNGKVVAVLGADFSYDVYTKIVEILNPIETISLYITIFMIILLLLAYILVYLYYKTRKRVFIDPLTQIYNRQYLTEFLERNALQNYALMIIDLDHFKRINDNFGHDVGDDVLVAVATKISQDIRAEDVFVRMGGEEFLLLIAKRGDSNFIQIAERIRKSVMQMDIKSREHKINVTLSIGVNPSPFKAKNIEEAIKIADEQLYIAKSSGRNRVVVFDEKESYESEATHRISEISLAIDKGDIHCAFQPIYSAKDHRIVKYEMLMRMINKEGEIVSPNNFLPLIRNTQIYITLTSIVLQKAIETLEQNRLVHLAVNLDIQDILNKDIMNMFYETFENRKELAQRLTVEILEHEEIKNFTLIEESIERLKSVGFAIALDDFGSGYANFGYLLNLNIDILKIDGTIIRDIDKNRPAYNIVKAIVSFAKSMEMETVAEMVNTKEEYETLVEVGVDYLQGYYLGHPELNTCEEV